MRFDKIQRQVIDNKESESQTEFHNTSLLFDLSSIALKYDKYDDTEIKQMLEQLLLNNDLDCFQITITSDYAALINSLFESQSELQLKDIKEDLNELKAKVNQLTLSSDLFKELGKTSYFAYTEPYPNKSQIEINTYFPLKFEIIRILSCSNYADFIASIANCNEWSQTGGKSKATFFKSSDNRYIIKCISKLEFKMFLESGSNYFDSMNKYFFHEMCSALAKVIGVFKIVYDGKKKMHCIIMENLFFDIQNKDSELTVYDLKGSKINRYVKNKKPGAVLLDTNFLENFNGDPLPLDKGFYELLNSSIRNDSLSLQRMNVIDYSLLLILADIRERSDKAEEEKKDTSTVYIKVGVIDYFRKYTWDKQLETMGKKLINNFNDPTIIDPVSYKQRFRDTLQKYFIGV